ncbi:1-acyl-sn-glycerol-3-phosphate acyltransferase [Nostocoides sp. F2B08]|uniref:lysophospholipid acyltransferase family protein n=1 Tax=Nostocoides sp. F2B08 TaxID=2653936 RepID=UPI001262DA44|nr:lysophospholipid acyltransferase family protein [Tetrasphaera sp. F2B08]KAB7746076.1 1-acyl-sn-glycerol-3-phosphate acyltransferase [Tetrasphaera sp. F2B08]
MPKPRNLNPAYRFAAVVVRPVVRRVTKQEWSGHEHIPADGGFVMCVNHISYADVFGFAHFAFDSGREPYLLGKESVFRIPVGGRILAKAGMIPVYRETGQAADAFRAAVEAVREGKCVAIYPEGTLTRDPDLWPMAGKTGAARVALETRCPVIPVAQWGAQEILGRYEKKLRLFPRKTMRLRAGPPVELNDLYDEPMSAPVLREATDRVMAAITRELEVIRGEPAPQTRFDARAAGLPPIGRYRPEDARPVSATEPSTGGENQSSLPPPQPVAADEGDAVTTNEREERA